MQEVAAGVEIAAGLAAAKAREQATKMKIEEGIADYQEEINKLIVTHQTKSKLMSEEMARTRALGVATLTETGKQSAYETKLASMKATQTASSAEARIGASGLKATGTALMGAQQETDIAYAAADRTAEAGAANVNIGGLQLGNTLKTQAGQKSLLTLEYKQNLASAERRKTELIKNKQALMNLAFYGGLADVASGFYHMASAIGE